ncbi:unnamed protein product [Anisakis simplex]|uniref:Protein lin-52 homolog (inferred by orthology to a human protein) n=1 Tax=Anisakis simplex TaxID=6269 RepID=A0A0M3JBV9_ANISI|nr:unnamed protein product [Anisakis simplex]VDK24678.1 unnamed protein product [Anisakis simplex]
MSEGSSVTRENFLACSEQIGRSSPELWPEQLPGAWDMWKNCSAPGTKPTKFRTDLGPSDVRFVNELGQLSPDQLMDYVRTLQNNVYTLGMEEGKCI